MLKNPVLLLDCDKMNTGYLAEPVKLVKFCWEQCSIYTIKAYCGERIFDCYSVKIQGQKWTKDKYCHALMVQLYVSPLKCRNFLSTEKCNYVPTTKDSTDEVSKGMYICRVILFSLLIDVRISCTLFAVLSGNN